MVDFRGIAYYRDTPKTGSRYSFRENKLIELVEYLIDNIYVNMFIKQSVGILMGMECAPLLAKRFLFYYEYRYMKSFINNNIALAKKYKIPCVTLMVC